MKKQLLLGVFSITLISSIFYSCTKDIGVNPLLDKNSPYTDKSLLDSCRNGLGFFYYNNGNTITSLGSAVGSPHGNFKLKFNTTATAALGPDGKLPVGGTFPEGSMVVKETIDSKFAFLYKRNGTWLWGETSVDGANLVQSVNSDPGATCVNCHNRPAARDYVLSFNFY
jgi:hypothetical protein